MRMNMQRGTKEDPSHVPSLDALFDDPARNSVADCLCRTGSMDFMMLLRQVGLTAGNLSFHLSRLRSAGFLSIEKGLFENKRRTTIDLTEKGRTAFRQYRNVTGQVPIQLAKRKLRRDPAFKGAEGTREAMPGREGYEFEASAVGARGEKADLLKSLAMFSGLTQEQIADLCRISFERHIGAGQFLYFEGERLGCFYVIIKGKIKILMNSPSGRTVILAFRGPWAVLANLAVFSGDKQYCSAQAVVDSDVLAIKNSDFLSFLSDRPELGYKILQTMLVVAGQRSMRARKQLMELAVEGAEYRIARTLLRLTSEFGPVLSFTREEVAQLAGTSTETAIRFVSALEKKHIVRTGRRAIVILNEGELRRLMGVSF